jgi:hypothetical protein
MTVQLTDNAISASEATKKTPVIVLKFEGLGTLFGPVAIKEYIRIGDPGLVIGNGWDIGGTIDIDDQKPYLQVAYSTSTIRQEIDPDRGAGSSISSMKIRLIDYRQEITQLITPGNTFTDPLGKRVTVQFGFQETAYPEDFFVVFKGVVEGIDAGPGWIDFSFNHPDELKRTTLFDKQDTTLNGAINSSTTSITLADASNLIEPADVLRSFVKIDDEFIEFTSVTGNNLNGEVRGALFGTDPKAIAAAHDDGASVEPFYILEDNVVSLALKLMLSGGPTYYVETLAVESFTASSLLFLNQDLIGDYNITPGDLMTVTLATNGGNNVVDEVIASITKTDDGTVVSFDGSPFTPELSSPGVAKFKSRYNVLPVGAGMLPLDVDIDRHEEINETFTASISVRCYIDDSFKLKEFLEEQLYNPAGLFSLPRKGQSSLGIHIPPLAGKELIILNQDNIKNPSNIVVSRGTNTNFQNAIVYKLDRDLYEEKYRKGVITTDVQSISEIGKRRDYVVESNGLRSTLSGQTIAAQVSNRRLERYRRGSEYIKGLKLTLRDGMRLEAGDVVVLDPTGLSLINTLGGDRTRPAQLWELSNREFNLKGEVTADLVQTNYDSTKRYAQISPASKIESGTTTQLVLKSSFQSRLGDSEYRKWEDFIGANVTVRNASFSVSGDTTISAISGNVITLSPALSFTPLSDYILEFTDYDNQLDDTVKLIYGFATDDDNDFADGGTAYLII